MLLHREPDTSCTDIKLRTAKKIEEIDQKIGELQRFREPKLISRDQIPNHKYDIISTLNEIARAVFIFISIQTQI